jgi:hypothetical protein
VRSLSTPFSSNLKKIISPFIKGTCLTFYILVVYRLSKLTGKTLEDNNPIAELSDPNRPTKLGEFYSELYDNEWTNALDVLHLNGHDEDIAIETLKLTLLVWSL